MLQRNDLLSPVLRCLVLILAIGMALPLLSGVQATAPAMNSRLASHTLSGRAIHLSSLDRDGSGITWHAHRNTLFVIRNTSPVIQELDTAGRLLREIQLKGFSDTEGLTWIAGDLFAVLEERRCAVVFLTIEDGTMSINRHAMPSLARPDMNADGGNQGCEDIAWDGSAQALYLSREMSPVRLLRISGFSIASLMQGRLDERALVEHELTMPTEQLSLLGEDISGLHYDAATRQLLVLSDESQTVTAVDEQGRLSPPFRLGWFSSGLLNGIPQAEGVTMDETGALFVLSEPDYLYIFRHRVN